MTNAELWQAIQEERIRQQRIRWRRADADGFRIEPVDEAPHEADEGGESG